MTAIVEGVAQIDNTQLATVRLQGSGSRMTNLQVVGGSVAVGDTVTVDMASGGKPYVRPNTPEATTIDSDEYEEMMDSFEDNTDDQNPLADYPTELDKLLSKASKAVVCKVVNGEIVINTLGAELVSPTSIRVPIRGIYWTLGISEVNEGSMYSIGIDLDDLDYDTSWNSDTMYDDYYFSENMIGSNNMHNISSVFYADAGDTFSITLSGFAISPGGFPSVVSSEATVVLINPGNGIGYNPYRSG
jgi:hypothetical protein